MFRPLPIVFLIIALIRSIHADDVQLAKLPSYPIELRSSEVRECANLEIALNGLKIETGPVVLVPISCEAGVTGAVIIGNGAFRYAPEGGDTIEGRFRSVVLRFNPSDWPVLVKLDRATQISDSGAEELGRTILKTAFTRCWHRNNDALIPPEKTLTVDLFSREHGELLIATATTSATVYNFKTRQVLFEKK